MKQAREELEEVIKKKTDDIESNVNFRLDQLKLDEVRKDTEELKSLGNKQTENLNNVDTRLTERMDRIQKIVEDFVAE